MAINHALLCLTISECHLRSVERFSNILLFLRIALAGCSASLTGNIDVSRHWDVFCYGPPVDIFVTPSLVFRSSRQKFHGPPMQPVGNEVPSICDSYTARLTVFHRSSATRIVRTQFRFLTRPFII